MDKLDVLQYDDFDQTEADIMEDATVNYTRLASRVVYNLPHSFRV
jgi:hypothetical protein